MNRNPTRLVRATAVAVAVLVAAACTDAEPTAPTANEALSPHGLATSLDGSADNDANRENDRPHVNIQIDGRDVELQFVNPTPFAWSFDYRVDGEPEGTPDQWTGETISEGPLEGQDFGLRYFPVTLIGVGEQTVTVTPEEQVEVRLARGAEQNWYFDWITIEIPCIAEVLRFDENEGEPDVVASFNTIQEAVDFAEPGDRILVEGECDENVVVATNGLHILGVDRPVLTSTDPTAPPGGDRGNFRVRADEVTIEGFVLAGGHYGVRASGSRNVIVDNEVSGMSFRGILASGSKNVVRENQVTGGSRHGIELAGTAGEVAHNTVLDANRNGLLISGSGHAVSHNEVIGSGRDGSDGVRVQGTGHTINHNLIAENGRLRAGTRQGSGLVIEADDVSVVHTTVRDNFLHGVVLAGNVNEIVQSTVEANGGTGVRIAGNENVVNQSRICENGFAPSEQTGGEETSDVHVLPGASSNTIQNSEVGELQDDGDDTQTRRIRDC
jgi:hypothetical protein